MVLVHDLLVLWVQVYSKTKAHNGAHNGRTCSRKAKELGGVWEPDIALKYMAQWPTSTSYDPISNSPFSYKLFERIIKLLMKLAPSGASTVSVTPSTVSQTFNKWISLGDISYPNHDDTVFIASALTSESQVHRTVQHKKHTTDSCHRTYETIFSPTFRYK